MLLAPDNFAVTGDNPHGTLTWVDDATLESPTTYWSLGHDPDAATGEPFRLVNEQADTTPVELTADDTLHVPDLDVAGELTSTLTLAGEQTHITGFDANDYHWLAESDTADILGFERRAEGDFRLHVSEGDTTERVLTTGDSETGLDAATLDENTPDEFVYRDGRYALTGHLAADDSAYRLRAAGDDTNQLAYNSTLGGARLRGTGGIELATGSSPTTGLRVTGDNDVEVPNGTITQQGNAVLTEATDTRFNAQNTDGTDLVNNVEAVTAGSNLAFGDDGDQTVTLSYTGADGNTSAIGTSATASGDGSQTTFTLAHSHGDTPDSVDVTPTSEAASTDFWVTGTTTDDVTIEYATAPPSGTDNLSWYVTTTDSGSDTLSVSDSGTTRMTGPDDLNFAADLTVADDGDQTVTIDVADYMAATDASETISEPWHFESTLGVEGDLDLTNDSQTAQFAWRYDGAGDRAVFEDVANTTVAAEVDRNGVVNFPENAQVAGVDVATTADDLANSGSGDAADGEVPVADGDGNVAWEHRTTTNSVTTSGDGSTTTFALSHGLGAVPSGAVVQPTSRAAMSDFYVSNKTADDVVIEYANAPPDGTDNLAWDVLAHQ